MLEINENEQESTPDEMAEDGYDECDVCGLYGTEGNPVGVREITGKVLCDRCAANEPDELLPD